MVKVTWNGMKSCLPSDLQSIVLTILLGGERIKIKPQNSKQIHKKKKKS